VLDEAGDRLGLVVGRDDDQRPHVSSVVSSGLDTAGVRLDKNDTFEDFAASCWTVPPI
jgi:hypothetical protein